MTSPNYDGDGDGEGTERIDRISTLESCARCGQATTPTELEPVRVSAGDRLNTPESALMCPPCSKKTRAERGTGRGLGAGIAPERDRELESESREGGVSDRGF